MQKVALNKIFYSNATNCKLRTSKKIVLFRITMRILLTIPCKKSLKSSNLRKNESHFESGCTTKFPICPKMLLSCFTLVPKGNQERSILGQVPFRGIRGKKGILLYTHQKCLVRIVYSP